MNENNKFTPNVCYEFEKPHFIKSSIEAAHSSLLWLEKSEFLNNIESLLIKLACYYHKLGITCDISLLNDNSKRMFAFEN